MTPQQANTIIRSLTDYRQDLWFIIEEVDVTTADQVNDILADAQKQIEQLLHTKVRGGEE